MVRKFSLARVVRSRSSNPAWTAGSLRRADPGYTIGIYGKKFGNANEKINDPRFIQTITQKV